MTSVDGKTILITGGASLVGSHVADALLAANAKEVRLFDNFSLGTPETIKHLQGHPRVRQITGDVLKPDQINAAMDGVSGVVALAGFLTLPMSQNPLVGIAVNCSGIANTLEACRLAGTKRIVFSSSTAVYGNSNPPAMVEDTPYVSVGLSPASATYSSSKLVGEALCALYRQNHGIEFNVLRFSTVYGERQHLRAVNAAFLAMVYEAVRKGERPKIRGDGTEVHDYIYVTDVADACVAALTSATSGLAMNISTGVDVSHTELVDMIIKASGAKGVTPEYLVDDRKVRSSSVRHLKNSFEAAKAGIGWTPRVSMEDGIRRYIAWRESPAAANFLGQKPS